MHRLLLAIYISKSCNYSQWHHMTSHDNTWLIISPWTRWCNQQLRLQHSERDLQWRGWMQPVHWCFVLSFPLSSCVLLLLNLPVSVRGKEGGVKKRESRGWKDEGDGKMAVWDKVQDIHVRARIVPGDELFSVSASVRARIVVTNRLATNCT